MALIVERQLVKIAQFSSSVSLANDDGREHTITLNAPLDNKLQVLLPWKIFPIYAFINCF
jgi:hypothetical protein